MSSWRGTQLRKEEATKGLWDVDSLVLDTIHWVH
jgi:hypothetical protein